VLIVRKGHTRDEIVGNNEKGDCDHEHPEQEQQVIEQGGQTAGNAGSTRLWEV